MSSRVVVCFAADFSKTTRKPMRFSLKRVPRIAPMTNVIAAKTSDPLRKLVDASVSAS